MSTTHDIFTLNPAHTNFVPGESKLESNTLWSSRVLVGFFLICGLFFAIFTVVMIFLFNAMSREMELLRTQGVEATGQVISCDMVTVKSYGSIPRLTYAYSWNNVSLQGSELIYHSNQDCAPYLNQTVAVRVVTSEPGISRLIMTETANSYVVDAATTGMSVFIVVMYASMSAFCLFPFWKYRQTKRISTRLMSEGYLLNGEITKISGFLSSKGSNFIVRVAYQFQSPTGVTLKRQMGHHRQDLQGTTLPPVGTPVTILYADDKTHVML